MIVRLEPVFLAHVLLKAVDSQTIELFPFISKNCQIAMFILKANPWLFRCKPQKILKFFPNINTMHVDFLTNFEATDTLPDTVTAIVVWRVGVGLFSWSQCKYNDRVVEIDNLFCRDNERVDLRAFPRLERLGLQSLPAIQFGHKLKKVKILLEEEVVPSKYFFFEWADQVVLVLRTEETFLKTKQHPFPPHVHIFCSDIGESVAPEDF